MEKRIIILPLFLIGIIFLSGCTEYVEDCGTDGNCFQEALKDCKNVRVELENRDIIMEITGKEGDSCLVHCIRDPIIRLRERDCLIKMDTILNGTSRVDKAISVYNHLENCSVWI